jgi:hypothetical protein
MVCPSCIVATMPVSGVIGHGMAWAAARASPKVKQDSDSVNGFFHHPQCMIMHPKLFLELLQNFLKAELNKL